MPSKKIEVLRGPLTIFECKDNSKSIRPTLLEGCELACRKDPMTTHNLSYSTGPVQGYLGGSRALLFDKPQSASVGRSW